MINQMRFLTLLALVFASAGCGSAEEMAHAGPAMNFHRISPNLATGGHFTDDGIAAIDAEGVSLVIDLRDAPPADQRDRLQAVGIRYINVPVSWNEPKIDDFTEFARHMAENASEHVLVQCQANYRASAMTYAYRVAEQGVPEEDARGDLEAIWTPEGTWERYINEIVDDATK